MKKFLLIITILFVTTGLSAQNFAINTDGSSANASALLDVKSTAKGVLIPRMTKTEKNAIVSPATGLLIFQSGPDSVGFHFYNGSQWSWLSIASNLNWLTTGNAGTSAATNFLGTTDNQPLSFRQNNLWIGRFDKTLQNYSIGDSAGANLTGTGNIAIGKKALKKATNPGSSIAIGDSAMANSTSISPGVAIGFNSMAAGTTALYNTAVGAYTIASNPAAFGNTAVGNAALYLGVSGDHNTMIGTDAGRNNAANINTAVGSQAMRNNTTGTENAAFGYSALVSNTTGVWNIAIGNNSIHSNVAGNRNVGIGVGATYWGGGFSSATTIGTEAGSFNNRNGLVAIGDQAAFYNSTGSSNLSEGIENTAVGYQALMSNRIGSKNTAVGHHALITTNGSSHSRNTAVGDSSMANTTGSRNTAVGVNSLGVGLGSTENVAIGDSSMGNALSTSYNVAVGYKSLNNVKAATGINTGVGYFVLAADTTGVGNAGYGSYSLTANRTGSWNTAYGSYSLISLTAADGNTAIGHRSLNDNSTGIDNAAVGFYSLYQTTAQGNTAIGTYAGNTNITGSNNTMVGYFSAVSLSNLTNATAIGYQATVNTNNKIRLGNTLVTTVETQTNYSVISDGRFKENIKEDVKGLDFINRLRPVTYNFNYNKFEDFLHPLEKSENGKTAEYKKPAYQQQLRLKSQLFETGFIAQEVEKAVIESGYHFNGVIKPQNENDNYSLDYSKMVVPLVKAVQELSSQNDEIKKQNDQLKKKNEELEKDLRLIKIKLGIPVN